MLCWCRKARREWRNPFLPYEEDLWVQHLSESHTLLLNKFNIVPHHCLVVTRRFEAQEEPLDEADFAATWMALQVGRDAAGTGRGRGGDRAGRGGAGLTNTLRLPDGCPAVSQAPPNGALAFYNCGPLSGASQPHKHVQLLPLPIWEAAPAGETGATTFTRHILAATANSVPWAAEELRSLPFASFAARLPAADEECSPAALAAAYAGLLQRCTEFAGSRGPGQGEEGPAPLSYNMVLTRTFMMLVPRRAEADGPISCNSVAFAGSFFVRSTEELGYVRGTGPMRILSSVGFPWE